MCKKYDKNNLFISMINWNFSHNTCQQNFWDAICNSREIARKTRTRLHENLKKWDANFAKVSETQSNVGL